MGAKAKPASKARAKSKSPTKKGKVGGEKKGTKKAQPDPKKLEEMRKEAEYKKLEAYVNESGLSLAFNIIFAELISKQILPENFFAYTAMRLKQIGKEIEGMKTKVPMYVDKPKVDDNNEPHMKTEGDEAKVKEPEKPPKNEEDDVFMTAPKNNQKIKK